MNRLGLGGSRWPMAEGTGAATGAVVSKEPWTPSHVGSVDFRSAIDTELGRRSQEAADLAVVEDNRPPVQGESVGWGSGGSGETVFQGWRGNKDPCRRLFPNAGLYSFSSWSQFRSHHTTTIRPTGTVLPVDFVLFAVAYGTENMTLGNIQ